MEGRGTSDFTVPSITIQIHVQHFFLNFSNKVLFNLRNKLCI